LKKLIEQVEAERQSQEAVKSEAKRQQQIEETAKAEAKRQQQIEKALTIKIYQPFKCVKTLNRVGNSSVNCVVISPDGKTFASDSSGDCSKIWNLQTGELIRTFYGHLYEVSCVAINPNGKILASGSSDKQIKLWNLETGQEISTLKGHSGLIRSLAFSPDGETLVSGSSDHTIRLWNLKTRTGNRHSHWTFKPGLVCRYQPGWRNYC
jgi:WD40 repeat protein